MTVLKFIILVLLFIGTYLLGLHRGHETHKNDYDDGYNAALNDSCDECYKSGFADALETVCKKGRDPAARAELASQVIAQIEDLFGDEEGPDDAEEKLSED